MSVSVCPHGSEPFNHEKVAGWDDWFVLETYSACDCCDGLMHKSTEYQHHSDGRTLCFTCRDNDEPETMPESWVGGEPN